MAIDRALVTSGFDTETVVSEDYLTYLLLAQIEAGQLPLGVKVADPATGNLFDVTLHPPTDYQRLYQPDPAAPLPEAVTGSFAIRLLPDGDEAFMHVVVWVSVDGPGVHLEQVPAGMFVDLELESDPDALGFLERNHTLRLSLVGVDPTTRGALVNAGLDPDAVEASIREELDRSVPLGVAQGQTVQQVRMRKFVTAGQRSLGLYADLALKAGPEPSAFRPPRGDVDLAQDFRPPGAPIAFATSQGLYGLLGPDAKFRQAEEKPAGSGNFHFPLREDPMNPDSDQIGRIKGVSVGPEIGIGGLTGRLLVDVHGEYTDAAGDPDFHLQLFFDPEVDAVGVVEWDLDVDVDLGLLATILLIAVGIGLTLLFGPGLGWGSTLLVGTFTGLAVLKGLVAEPLAAKMIEDRMDEETQASFLDALPLRVPAARRRWDPFYVTDHQVVALVERVVVDTKGIAFESTGLALDKQPVPIASIVIRDEDRTAGTVSGLRYRVSDLPSILTTDLAAAGPGRDTLEWTRTDPVADPTLVSLTDDQIVQRIATRRLQAPLTYTAERIFVVEGQIDGLLCISRRERAEQRQRVIDSWRSIRRAEIRQQDGAAIRAELAAQLELDLGRPPTAQELNAAVEARLTELVNGEQPQFEESRLPLLLEIAIDRVLRFDLTPEEMIERQELGALLLDGVEIIERKNANGTRTKYYRDQPDGFKPDNLLSLPHYTPPYVPPA